MPTLVVATPNARRAHDALQALGGLTVIERPELAGIEDDRVLITGLRDAWAVVAGGERYSAAVLGALPGLRAILRWGIGYDAIDVPAATAAGVAVLVTPGANAEAVADLALALMLACLRRLPELNAKVRAGDWRPAPLAGDLAGATVGIVGLGSVGRAVTARVRGFGCPVLALEPHPDRAFCAAHDVELTGLEDLLARSAVVTLHAPLTAATRHLIGARELALLPRHAVLVNTSRGSLVDQAALVAALQAGELGAAGLDVYEQEPPAPGDPLIALSNVVLTPHIASYSELGSARTAAAVVGQVAELLAGRAPAGCLNPEVLARG